MNDSFYARIRSQMRHPVKRMKGRSVGARFDTSDVIQEAMIQVWNDVEKSELSDVVFPDALINCIGRGHSAKMARYHTAAKRSVAKENAAVPDLHLDDVAGPPSNVERGETINTVRDAIGQLAADQKFVLYRRVFEDATFHAIGEDFGVTAQKARRIYYRAIRNVQSIQSAAGNSAAGN